MNHPSLECMLLLGSVQRQITCPFSKRILDVRKALLLSNPKGSSQLAVHAEWYDANEERIKDLVTVELDGREVPAHAWTLYR